jgi:hypothetical protein
MLPSRCRSWARNAELSTSHADAEEDYYAELELDDIPRGKYDFDVAGHYSRPDVFQLSVNENPQNPVSEHGVVNAFAEVHVTNEA